MLVGAVEYDVEPVRVNLEWVNQAAAVPGIVHLFQAEHTELVLSMALLPSLCSHGQQHTTTGPRTTAAVKYLKAEHCLH